MRNFLGAILSFLLGVFLIVYLLNVIPAVYPEPINTIGTVLSGASVLQHSSVHILTGNAFQIMGTWTLMGIIAGFASDSKWNTIRTILWIGLLLGILNLLSIFALNPMLWSSEQITRNMLILTEFIISIFSGLLALGGAIPIVIAIQYIQRESEVKPLEQIKTVCKCGAVFKSRPMICSECGATLIPEDVE